MNLKRVSYSDSTFISAEDVKMAIKRTLLFNPGGLYSNLAGAADWLKKKSPLMHDLQGVSGMGSQVTLIFSNDHKLGLSSEPVFIIPSKCIDPASAKLLCRRPPFSGPYKTGASSFPVQTFEKRLPVSPQS